MKIDNISLFSNDFQTPETLILNVPFRDPTNQVGYIIKGIFGLDADELLVKLYGTNQPNYFSYGARPNIYALSMAKRDLVVRLGLNPRNTNGETFSTLRDRIYKAISSSRSGLVIVVFYEGEAPVAKIGGFITKVEASHFEQNPEIQVTLSCKDPMFRAPNVVEISSPDFTFDLDLYLGVLNVEDSVSTAPHGFKFVAEITDDVQGFYIHDDPDDLSENRVIFELAPGNQLLRAETGFLDGDIITINSEPGALSVTCQFNGVGVHYPIADVVTPQSIWPLIFPGPNEFYTSPSATINSVSYTPVFWGV